jgi:hypothetical protein
MKMHEAKKSYCPGLEIYSSPDMGLCGIENDARGNQSTYQYLTVQEAQEWMQTWLDGKSWRRNFLPGEHKYARERNHA